MIVEIAGMLILIGLTLVGTVAFFKWITIIIDCFILGEFMEGFFFTGIGLFFIGIVIASIFGNVL